MAECSADRGITNRIYEEKKQWSVKAGKDDDWPVLAAIGGDLHVQCVECGGGACPGW